MFTGGNLGKLRYALRKQLARRERKPRITILAHSLGGGVTLKGMAGQDAFGNTVADLGVVFNF